MAYGCYLPNATVGLLDPITRNPSDLEGAMMPQTPHWLQQSDPNLSPKINPSRGLIPEPNYLPHPWTHLIHQPKPHTYPIRHFVTMHWTDTQTDSWRKCSMTIGHFHSIETIGMIMIVRPLLIIGDEGDYLRVICLVPSLTAVHVCSVHVYLCVCA